MRTKRILILDDDPVRHVAFDRMFLGHEVLHARDYHTGMELIRFESLDLACLDHDLNDFGKNSVVPGMYGGSELTGLDFAKWLASLPRGMWPGRVLVHSHNEEGAQSMETVLRVAGLEVLRREFVDLDNPVTICHILGPLA